MVASMDGDIGIDAGPVELTLLEFPRGSFGGEITAVLADLVDREIVSIVDLVMVSRDEAGNLEVIELADADPETARRFAAVNGEVMWLLSDRDVAEAAARLEPGAIGVLVVWENRWARHLKRAVTEAGGRVVVHDRLDPDEVAASMAASPGD
jgi:hypothetical protein